MANTEDYININRNTWNQKTSIHIQSEFYDMKSFLNGKNTLNAIELNLLGNIRDKSVLHLQCHFGQDTMSLSMLGAQSTGVDFSGDAIHYAESLAAELKLDTTFILSDIYSLKSNLSGQFDIVFTSYGVIGWLPDLDMWADIINHFLKPGGIFVMVEFHPMVWMFDNDFTKISYSYFNDGHIEETEEGSYADRNENTSFTTITWNHALDEVFTSLIDQGLVIQHFKEYNYSPYNCLKHMEEPSPGQFSITHLGQKVPLVYAIKAIKPGD